MLVALQSAYLACLAYTYAVKNKVRGFGGWGWSQGLKNKVRGLGVGVGVRGWRGVGVGATS